MWVEEEKNLSKDFSNFVPDEYSETTADASRQFDLDEYVRKAKALKSEFVHDLEQQRKSEESRTLQTGEDEEDSSARQEMEEQTAKMQEEARQQGYEEGHKEGYQAGTEAVREQFTSSMNALQSLVDELSAVREKTYPLLEREMVEMVTTLTRKVVRAELQGKEDGIRNIVRLAVESVLDRESLVIKIHPDDYKELEDYGQELIQLFHDIKNIEFESHTSVPHGHCVVESNFGTVEAGLDHLDEHIAKVLHLAPPAPVDAPPQDKMDEPEESETSS